MYKVGFRCGPIVKGLYLVGDEIPKVNTQH